MSRGWSSGGGELLRRCVAWRRRLCRPRCPMLLPTGPRHGALLKLCLDLLGKGIDPSTISESLHKASERLSRLLNQDQRIEIASASLINKRYTSPGACHMKSITLVILCLITSSRIILIIHLLTTLSCIWCTHTCVEILIRYPTFILLFCLLLIVVR